jgi:Short C-terminal domain
MAGKHRARSQEREADQDDRISGLEQDTYAQPAPAPAPASGGLTPDAMDQLKQLAQLHEQGILTDQEFDQQKAKILAG